MDITELSAGLVSESEIYEGLVSSAGLLKGLTGSNEREAEQMDINELLRQQIAAEYKIPAEILNAEGEEEIRKQAEVARDYLGERGASLTTAQQFAQWVEARENAPFLAVAQDAGIMAGVRDGGEPQHIPAAPTTGEQFAMWARGIL